NLHVVGGTVDPALTSIERISLDNGMSGSMPADSGRSLANTRFGIRAAVVGPYLYLFGGHPRSAEPVPTVARFQIDADGTLPRPSPPGGALAVRRAGPAVAILGGQVYVYGGRTGPGAFTATGDRFTIGPNGDLVGPNQVGTGGAPPNMTSPRGFFQMV